MMKKLLLLCVAVFAVSTVSQAQINDTLKYFSYKQAFKLPVSASTVHPSYKSKAMVQTNTFVTHVGSIFKNKDANLMVTGLEARVLIPNLVASGPQVGGVPFRLYLCNVGPNGMPILPPIDSILTKVQATASNTFFAAYGQRVGATFTFGPRPVTGDFAVLARCSSGNDGDTVKIFRTAGHTATSTTAPSNDHKFGEGLGVVRYKGQFYKTTNFTGDPQFGMGTDYEFCLSPMVSFSLTVDQIASTTQEGACEWEVFTNTNTSSPEFTNKQFNFNEFCRQMKPFHPASAFDFGFVSDSVLAWDMGDGQNPYYLLPNWNDTIHLAYASGVSNTFFTGSVTGKYKQSVYNFDQNHPSIVASLVFTASTVWCNDSAGSSIHEMGPLANLKLFPNPTADKTTISGLQGKNTLQVFNMMGQMILSETTEQETVALDLSKQPQGNYLVRINNTQGNTRAVKIIRQ